MTFWHSLMDRTYRLEEIDMANRQYATLVAYDRSLIVVVDPNGKTAEYRQRGIGRLALKDINYLIQRGFLNPKCNSVPDFPDNWSLVNEAPEILGRVYVTFNINRIGNKKK